jgi:hypothetical protein
MKLITSHWHQIVFIIGLIVVAVKLNAQVKEFKKTLIASKSAIPTLKP